jgi:MFS family permease
MAASMLSPVLPRMRAVFAHEPRVDLLISFTATLPALFLALLSWPYGLLGDRLGHKRLLVLATLLYGLVGTAPLWLDTLPQIVVSRGLVGLFEAAVMTCSTTLIGDYFTAERRSRYLALQTGTAPIASVAVIALGGALGQSSWRGPFIGYGFAFFLIPLTMFLLWEPVRSRDVSFSSAPESASRRLEPRPETFRWGKLLWICAVTVFVMTAFLIPIIQIGFILTERGLGSPRLIGLWASAASLANPLGALLFGLLRWRSGVKLTLAFALMALGFVTIGTSSSWPAAVSGALIANVGCGMILPTLITWAIALLPPSQRGTGTGLWMAASFLGQFLSPLAVLALRDLAGSLSKAILVYGAACALSALFALISQMRWMRSAPA